jgi:hypothetical protein
MTGGFFRSVISTMRQSDRRRRIRWLRVASAALIGAAVVAGCGGGDGDSSIYVEQLLEEDLGRGVFAGEHPLMGDYERAFDQLRAGCTEDAVDLLVDIETAVDILEVRTGLDWTNLRVLQEMARRVSGKSSCADDFARFTSR